MARKEYTVSAQDVADIRAAKALGISLTDYYLVREAHKAAKHEANASKREARAAKRAAEAREGTPEEVSAASALIAYRRGGGKLSLPPFLYGLNYVQESGKTTDSAWKRIVAEYQSLPSAIRDTL